MHCRGILLESDAIYKEFCCNFIAVLLSLQFSQWSRWIVQFACQTKTAWRQRPLFDPRQLTSRTKGNADVRTGHTPAGIEVPIPRFVYSWALIYRPRLSARYPTVGFVTNSTNHAKLDSFILRKGRFETLRHGRSSSGGLFADRSPAVRVSHGWKSSLNNCW